MEAYSNATEIGVMFKTLETRVEEMQTAFQDPFSSSVQKSMTALKQGAFEKEFEKI
jgi:uncharacterized protein (DUF1800 family)